MNIGIDARTALLNQKGGFGVYTRNLIQSMASLYPKYSFDLKFHKKDDFFDLVKQLYFNPYGDFKKFSYANAIISNIKNFDTNILDVKDLVNATNKDITFSKSFGLSTPIT